MNEPELDKILPRLHAPEPSKEAQDRALKSALEAFDKNPGGASQKTRLLDIDDIKKRLMQKRYVFSCIGGAALACAVLVFFSPVNHGFIPENTQETLFSAPAVSGGSGGMASNAIADSIVTTTASPPSLLAPILCLLALSAVAFGIRYFYNKRKQKEKSEAHPPGAPPESLTHRVLLKIIYLFPDVVGAGSLFTIFLAVLRSLLIKFNGSKVYSIVDDRSNPAAGASSSHASLLSIFYVVALCALAVGVRYFYRKRKQEKNSRLAKKD